MATRTIRLLSVQAVAERGGSDQALLRMLRSLPPHEFECHVVVPAPHPLEPELRAAGATVHVVPMRRISTSHGVRDWVTYALAWPLTVLRLVRLIRRLRIDVVHTNVLHSWYPWAAAAVTRTPHVWHAREIVVQSRLALRVERFLTKHFADRVIAMSHAIADQLDRDDVIVVHEHPDPTEFSPAHAGRFRAAVGIADDVPLAGAAGRIDTWKGFDVVLDAWPRVREAVPDAVLVVAGGPVAGKERYAEALAARAATLDGVHWTGARRDVPDLLADLDCFVLASTEPEPYGLVLVEALASGAPAVVTDAGGAPEIVAAAAPDAGTLVPPGDAAALARAIVARLRRAAGRTSEATRRARPALTRPTPPPFAVILRGAAAGRDAAGRR